MYLSKLRLSILFLRQSRQTSHGCPVRKVVRTMLEQSSTPPAHLHIISKRARLQIPVSEIHFVEVFDWKCIIHCNAGIQYESNMPLKSIQTQLPSEQFIRCNRSFLVNLDHVSSVEKEALITDGGASVPISIRNRPEVRRICTAYFWHKNSLPQ